MTREDLTALLADADTTIGMQEVQNVRAMMSVGTMTAVRAQDEEVEAATSSSSSEVAIAVEQVTEEDEGAIGTTTMIIVLQDLVMASVPNPRTPSESC